MPQRRDRARMSLEQIVAEATAFVPERPWDATMTLDEMCYAYFTHGPYQAYRRVETITPEAVAALGLR